MRLGVVEAGEHSTLGPVNYSAMELGVNPDGQVARTIDVMRDRALSDAADSGFKARAESIAGSGTDLEKIERVYTHVKGSIRFQRDEATAQGLINVLDAGDVVEVIIRPVDMARYVDAGMAAGDCDVFSMYLAGMLNAVGVQSSFVTVAASGQAPDQYSHVYVVAYPIVDGQSVRMALDASHGEYAGWEVPNAFGKLREWPVTVGACAMGFVGTVGASVLGVWTAWWLWKRFGGGVRGMAA